MKTRVVNIHHGAPYDVRIDRSSIWGNPFGTLPPGIGRNTVQVPTRRDAIECYAEWIKEQPGLMALLPTLKGKALGCVCSPLVCHGDVLVKLVEELPR